MKAFRRDAHGLVTATIDRDEAMLLQSLSAQLATLLQDPSHKDPAIRRLLPDAYPDDAEASAEFRRLTESGLVERKLANTGTVLTTLSASVHSGELRLDSQQAGAWLRSLTDMRLTIASRLGIETDDQELDGDTILQGLYDWLGYLQNSLVEAMDA